MRIVPPNKTFSVCCGMSHIIFKLKIKLIVFFFVYYRDIIYRLREMLEYMI